MGMKKLAVLTLNKLLRNHTYTVKHGLAKGLRRRGGLAFLPASLADTSGREAEERFLLGLDLRGQTVYDVGGDQGIYTLFFASRVGPQGRVVTFEPNPESYRRIVTNVGLNEFRNVEVRPVGLGEERGRLTFVFPDGEPARGSADASIQAQILQEKAARTIEIEVNSLDQEAAAGGLPAPDLVKIDVEGLEGQVLRGMSRTLAESRPRLFIEIHGAEAGDKAENARQVVSILRDAGYKVVHVESGNELDSSNYAAASQGHVYCTPAA
ncbi:MAG: FkbM family methyltransferase [Pyrinomonadaceae bacterium]